MTKVLFVSHTPEPGGAELFLRDMVVGGPADWRAAFLADGPMAQDLKAAGRLAGVVQAGADLLKIRRSGGASLSAIAAVAKSAAGLARIARDYDILCANSQKALFVCAAASVISGKPLVWILHDIITDPAFSSVNRKAAILVANLRARRVVVNSNATAEGFRKAGGARPVDLVYNSFAVEAWPERSVEAGAALRAEFGLDERPIAALFGRLTPWKGQDVFLRALQAIPQVQGLIVGGPLFGEEAFEAELKALCAELGLEDRVRFTGFRRDAPTLMAGSEILVHASTHAEPFGRVIVEGQLSALPVIAADAGGVVDIVEDGQTGLLTRPGDPASLAAALVRLIEDPALSQRLSRAGREAAIARFNLDKGRQDLAKAMIEASA